MITLKNFNHLEEDRNELAPLDQEIGYIQQFEQQNKENDLQQAVQIQLLRKISDFEEHQMPEYQSLSPKISKVQLKNEQFSKIIEAIREDDDAEGNENRETSTGRNLNEIFYKESSSGESDFSETTQQKLDTQQNKQPQGNLKSQNKFEIRDLDTGEIFDSRSSEIGKSFQKYSFITLNHSIAHQESIFTQTASIGSSNDYWKQYWAKVKKNNLMMLDFSESGNLEGLQKLFNENSTAPTQINYQSLDNWTALHFASSQSHFNVIQFLLKQGADPCAQSQMQRTPLHSAVIGGSFHCVRELVKAGGKQLIDMQDNLFTTALHLATENDSIHIVEFLLRQGANFELKNHKQLMSFELCQSKEMEKLYLQFDQSRSSKQENNERMSIGGYLQRNNRADHVNKLLYRTEQVQKYAQQQKINEIEEKARILREMSWRDFKFIKKLGQGSFGEVYLVEKNFKHYAMKILSKSQVFHKNLQRYVLTEKNTLSSFHHPFIIKLQYAFQNEFYLFLVMEYAEGGDMGLLLNKKNRLPENDARIYTAQITLALEELHKKDIIYRDLKPDNVVLDKWGNAKLTDFGLSKEGIKEDTLTKSFCGSVAYFAPEILTKQQHSRTVDWYLLGTFLFELLVGIPPYYDNKKDVLFANIKRGPLKIPKNMSPLAKDLIRQLLNRNPRERLGSIQDSEDIKAHPFFKDINWEDVYFGRIKAPQIDLPKVDLNQKLQVNFDQPSKNLKLKGKKKGENEESNHIEKWSFIN